MDKMLYAILSPSPWDNACLLTKKRRIILILSRIEPVIYECIYAIWMRLSCILVNVYMKLVNV